MRPDLIEDLRSGYLDDPHEAMRELARLYDLNLEAADTILEYKQLTNCVFNCLDEAMKEINRKGK